jgi:hypothetical protein
MAFCAKHLIPRCSGAGILVSGALSLIFCLTTRICQDRPNSASVLHAASSTSGPISSRAIWYGVGEPAI